jgi:hypothetical protein
MPVDAQLDFLATPTEARPLDDVLLEQLFSDASRKTAFKDLTPAARVSLVLAVGVVARAKAQAYAQACAGVVQSNYGWISRFPDLAKATLQLQQAQLDVSNIPMATEHADI